MNTNNSSQQFKRIPKPLRKMPFKYRHYMGSTFIVGNPSEDEILAAMMTIELMVPYLKEKEFITSNNQNKSCKAFLVFDEERPYVKVYRIDSVRYCFFEDFLFTDDLIDYVLNRGELKPGGLCRAPKGAFWRWNLC